MPLSLKAMKYFTTALRHGSIVKAAAELNIAASAVSSAIDQVEAEFDLTLVIRQRARGIQANVAGRNVAQKCEHLLEDYRSLMIEGTELKQSQSGKLKIGYYAPIAPAFLPQVLIRFCQTVLMSRLSWKNVTMMRYRMGCSRADMMPFFLWLKVFGLLLNLTL